MTDILYRLRHAAADKRKDVWGLYREAADEIERLRSLDAIREALEELVDARAAYDRSLQTGTEKQTIRTEKRLFQAWERARAELSKHRDHPPAHRSGE